MKNAVNIKQNSNLESVIHINLHRPGRWKGFVP